MGRETIPVELTPVAATERAYDAVARIYDEAVSSPRDLAENALVSEMLREARRRAPSSSVLDLGCGTGLAVELLRADPIGYLGIDLSAGMLTRASERHPHHWFQHGDFMDVLQTFSDARFGMVVSTFGALNHVHPLRMSPLLDEVGRVLEPGGIGFLMFALPRRLRTYVAGGAPAYVYGEWVVGRSLPDSLSAVAVRGLSYGRRKPTERDRSVRRAILRLRAERWLLGRSVKHADWMIFEVEKERS